MKSCANCQNFECAAGCVYCLKKHPVGFVSDAESCGDFYQAKATIQKNFLRSEKTLDK